LCKTSILREDEIRNVGPNTEINNTRYFYATSIDLLFEFGEFLRSNISPGKFIVAVHGCDWDEEFGGIETRPKRS
jgi:hypothetical protein